MANLKPFSLKSYISDASCSQCVKNYELQDTYICELEGIESFQKPANSKTVNYEIVSYKDPLLFLSM